MSDFNCFIYLDILIDKHYFFFHLLNSSLSVRLRACKHISLGSRCPFQYGVIIVRERRSFEGECRVSLIRRDHADACNMCREEEVSSSKCSESSNSLIGRRYVCIVWRFVWKFAQIFLKYFLTIKSLIINFGRRNFWLITESSSINPGFSVRKY